MCKEEVRGEARWAAERRGRLRADCAVGRAAREWLAWVAVKGAEGGCGLMRDLRDGRRPVRTFFSFLVLVPFACFLACACCSLRGDGAIRCVAFRDRWRGLQRWAGGRLR